MFGFDKMFDFNRDGKLDSWERAAQFQFMDEMLKEDHSSSDFDDDEDDVFGDAAPVGQVSAQEPQSMQVLASMTYWLSP